MIRTLARLSIPAAALAAFLAPIGCAKTGPVDFMVSSSGTGAPIEGVRIDVAYPLRATFTPHDFTVVTDEQGAARRDVTRAPRIDIEIDEPGYRPLTQSIIVDEQESWTLHRDPTLLISAHERPASFEIVRDDAGEDVNVNIHLEWEERPTHIVILPDNFRGLILLTRAHDVPPLPDAPTPRVFTTVAASNGTAMIPAWPIEQAPYERFRFFTASGDEFPATPSRFHRQYVSKLREGPETVLFILGDESDETTLRQAMWIFSTTGASNLNVENFTMFVEMIATSDSPVTGLDVKHALAN